MYAKIENGIVTEYPIHEGGLSLLTSGFIFPLDSNEEINAINNNGLVVPEGYVRVYASEYPAFSYTSYTTESLPIFNEVESKWFQTFETIPYTEEELVINSPMVSENIRKKRNDLLLSTDIQVVADKWEEYSIEQKTEWKTYRQALRDVPAQIGFPYNITWPTISTIV